MSQWKIPQKCQKFDKFTNIYYIIGMNRDAFWKRIKTLIKEKGVTQETAAKACRLSPNTLRKWMSRRMIPPLSYAYYLSSFLGVSLEYLITGKEKNETLKIIDDILGMNKKESESLNKIRCMML